MTEPTPQLGPGQNIPELVAAAAHVRAAPPEFQADDFEPLPIVVSILQAPAREREERIRQMHELCTVFDADVAAVSNGLSPSLQPLLTYVVYLVFFLLISVQ